MTLKRTIQHKYYNDNKHDDDNDYSTSRYNYRSDNKRDNDTTFKGQRYNNRKSYNDQ